MGRDQAVHDRGASGYGNFFHDVFRICGNNNYNVEEGTCRESNHAATDLEKKKLELEKLREEITAKNAAAQNKRKMTKRRRGV